AGLVRDLVHDATPPGAGTGTSRLQPCCRTHGPVILCLWPTLVPECSCTGIALTDLDSPHQPLRLVPDEIDGQKTVVQIRALDLDTVCEDKSALELPGCDAPVKVLPALVLLLFPADR